LTKCELGVLYWQFFDVVMIVAVAVLWQEIGETLLKGKTAMIDKQVLKLGSRIFENLPDMPANVMQKWIENPKDLKKVLAEALCLPSVKIVRHLTALKHGTALPARTKKFVPKTFFKKRGVWTSGNFKNLILSHAKTVASAPETPVVFRDIEQSVKDVEIQAELPEDYVFNGVDSFLPFLAGLIDRQQGGKVGNMLNDGYVNIFHVRIGSEVFAVRVYCFAGGSVWLCSASRLDGVRWSAGSRVFSATAVA